MVDTVSCAKTKIFLNAYSLHGTSSVPGSVPYVYVVALSFLFSFQVFAFLANVEESMYGTNVA